MSKEREAKCDPVQPALIVRYGNTTRKSRPLDREVMVLGRAPGCDVGLESPDVAAVHCVIVRAADGWRVRDCTGRGGTRLNGRSVQDSPLCDEDVLQIGSFSFDLRLPPPPGARDAAAADHVRWSRRRFAQRALRLRRRLAEVLAEHAEPQTAGCQEDLDRQAEQLQDLQQDLDARFAELKRAAQDVAARGRALEERRQQVEKELAERQQKHSESVGDLPRILDVRARELGCYAAHLGRTRRRLYEHEDSLTARWEEWLRDQQEASAAQARQREQTDREEAMLRDQRSEVVRLMGEMRLLRQNILPPVEALRAEVDQLRRGLAESNAVAAAARAEAQELRALLAAREAVGDNAGPEGAAANRLRLGLESGRKELEGRILQVQERYADLERTSRDAESQIARERTRISQDRQELERLRAGLWEDEGRAAGAETVIDMPSPLRRFPEIVKGLEPVVANGEAAYAPAE